MECTYVLVHPPSNLRTAAAVAAPKMKSWCLMPIRTFLLYEAGAACLCYGYASKCNLSHAESLGFFCEDDQSWNRRRAIFNAQEEHQVSTFFDDVPERRGRWWPGNYEPNFS